MEQVILLEMGISDLWETGKYKELKCKVNSFNSLNRVINVFRAAHDEISKKYFIKIGKRNQKNSLRITDVNSFIKVFNDTYKNSSTRHKVNVEVDGWTSSAIDCFERCYNCNGCFYNKYPTINGSCRMKEVAKKFFRIYGDPLPEIKKELNIT